MLIRVSKSRHLEVLLGCALLTQLQWLFGNIYEEVLIPNSIAASIPALNAYNAFFRYTEPYHYYVPLTQFGCIVIWILAMSGSVPSPVKAHLTHAAVAGAMAMSATAFIVIHYNLRMFFGSVDSLGASVHRRYLEWAIWNAIRIVLVGCEVFFAIRAYRFLLITHSIHSQALANKEHQQKSEPVQTEENPR